MKLAEVREIIPRRKKEGFPAAFRLEMTQRHEQLMDEIRRQSAEAQDAVMQHLNMRKASKEASARNTIIAFFAGTTLSIALLISTFLLLRREITERRRTEKALRFSEARYRALYRDNPTMIVTLDTNFTMLAVNPICACLLGYLIEELEGESVLKLFHENDRPAVAEQLRNCLENPEQVHRWQFRKVRKDGSLLWVEETAQAVYDLNGTLNMLVVCQDITERKRAEDALRKSEKKFLKIFHAAPALVGITTLAEGRFVDVNETCARILGYQREELIGRTSLELGIWKSTARSATSKSPSGAKRARRTRACSPQNSSTSTATVTFSAC
jgi:PAS domain S-box-containing protein